MTKLEIVERIHGIDESIHLLSEERAMLCELLSEWPEGGVAIDSEPPDTEPGTPRTKSSQRMAAVRDAEARVDPLNKEPPDPSSEPPRDG